MFWPLLPLSRGHIHIHSSNPLDSPFITPRFLTDAFDQAVAVAITRRGRELLSSGPFKNVVSDPYYGSTLGPAAIDTEILAWYEDSSYGASHWMGSTAMLPRHLGGVVDSHLR